MKEFEDAQSAAAIIKDYLKDLCEPLIPYNNYDDFVNLSKLNQNVKARKARDLINRLPEVNKNTLWYLCWFCTKIVHHVDKNQMNSTNLGTCLGPTVCRAPRDEAQKELENTKAVIDSFALLLYEYKTIFGEISDKNHKMGMTPPNYPAICPKPFVPYESLVNEIRDIANEKMKRIEAKQKSGGRQTLMKRSVASSDFVARDGSEAARRKMNDLLNQNGSNSTTPTPSQHKRKRSRQRNFAFSLAKKWFGLKKVF